MMKKTVAATTLLLLPYTAVAFSPTFAVRKQAFAPPAHRFTTKIFGRGDEEEGGSSTATLEPPTVEQSAARVGEWIESEVKSEEKAIEFVEADKDMMVEGKKDDKDNLMQQVKDAGIAGVISYAGWELGFWAVSVPVVLAGYHTVTGHWPDLSNKDDVAKLSAEAFAFVNFARFAVPLRIGLALSTTPWIQANVVDKIEVLKKKDEETKLEE